MKLVNHFLTVEQIESLKKLSKLKSVSVGALIRMAINEYIEKFTSRIIEFDKSGGDLVGSMIKCFFITEDNPKPIEKELILTSGHYQHGVDNTIIFNDAELVDPITGIEYYGKGIPPFTFKINKTQPMVVNEYVDRNKYE